MVALAAFSLAIIQSLPKERYRFRYELFAFWRSGRVFWGVNLRIPAVRTPPTNPADAAELERLELAIRNARQRRAMFLREMTGRSRRRDTQRLCVLGRAVESLSAEHPRFADQFRGYLRTYVTRDTDRAALVGTPFEIADSAPSAPSENHVESERNED